MRPRKKGSLLHFLHLILFVSFYKDIHITRTKEKRKESMRAKHVCAFTTDLMHLFYIECMFLGKRRKESS